jgi:hypothetical protein
MTEEIFWGVNGPWNLRTAAAASTMPQDVQELARDAHRPIGLGAAAAVHGFLLSLPPGPSILNFWNLRYLLITKLRQVQRYTEGCLVWDVKV